MTDVGIAARRGCGLAAKPDACAANLQPPASADMKRQDSNTAVPLLHIEELIAQIDGRWNLEEVRCRLTARTQSLKSAKPVYPNWRVFARSVASQLHIVQYAAKTVSLR